MKNRSCPDLLAPATQQAKQAERTEQGGGGLRDDLNASGGSSKDAVDGQCVELCGRIGAGGNGVSIDV